MDFGRLANIDNFDFTLPPDPEANRILLASKSTGVPMQTFLGLPVWGEKSWLGTIYPNDAREKDFLKHYARQFNTIELNTTYYRIPTPQTIEGWKAATPAHFKFCPKIPQEISHTQQLVGAEILTRAFCEVLRGLEERLGTIFLQLSPYFGTEKIELLKSFIKDFPNDLPLAVELRHENWFHSPRILEDLLSFLADHDVGTVITDTAGRRDVLHQRLTTTTAFIRFTANDLHPSDFTRIEDWATRLAYWKNEGLEQLYFFIHSPTHTHMPQQAQAAANTFNTRFNANIRPCQFMQDQQPELF